MRSRGGVAQTCHLSAAGGDAQCGRRTWNLEAARLWRRTCSCCTRLLSRRMNGLLWIDERRSCWDTMCTVWLEALTEDAGERLVCQAECQPLQRKESDTGLEVVRKWEALAVEVQGGISRDCTRATTCARGFPRDVGSDSDRATDHREQSAVGERRRKGVI